MAVTVKGLKFFPLWWVHHDNWEYKIPLIPQGFDIRQHYGHQHIWMMGYDPATDNGDAFSGRMQYEFSIQDIWGPRSGDKNQQEQYVVRGRPKWYFHVQELWRRVYIQQWDEKITIPDGKFVGRKGIKYDASQRLQTFGPFREGLRYAPYWINNGGRTLPVEYYNTEARDRAFRDNYIKEKYRQADGLTARPFDEDFYVPPANGDIPLVGTPGGTPTYADGLYIEPIVEYQLVKQLDWERLPGYEEKNDKDDVDDFGDGWSIDVTVPFTDPRTGKYRSPFGPDVGVVRPIGEYYNGLVDPTNMPKYRAAQLNPPNPLIPNDQGGYDYRNRPFGLTQDQSEDFVRWNNPYGSKADGKWVQQCLGGIVQAQAVVTIESKLNNAGPKGYQQVTVNATQYLPTDAYAGFDQAEPIDPEEAG